ncbi:hypothetical protein [Salinispora sp. H7-4]|uniref:hypothetical protein n=1 Tax=Salinispora sp. H7-4 TaxID=2748321 RepID=UPI0015D2779C|nr:hypothetical protein [Salinispora sp. H7-4]NYT96522.1 hypothetical protein [Salinispora sp. H7-4]
MLAARRTGRTTAAALALMASLAGCGVVTDRAPADLSVGHDSQDGSLMVWPARGSLAAEAATTTAVTEAVRAWRSPLDDRAYLPTSGILWVGEVDGAPLALVAADVPGTGSSWLLQVAGEAGRHTVTHAVEHTDPGYLIYSDVLPVHTDAGRRYLVSARVTDLTGPDGEAVTIEGGLSAPVAVPACSAVPVTATLRATESLPQGRATDRFLDLGTGLDAPRDPLVRDESGSGQQALAGLDTCALAGDEGPFGSIQRQFGSRKSAKSVPASWPMSGLTIRTVGEGALGAGPPGEVQQLTWEAAGDEMTAMLYRPATGGAPLMSAADPAAPLQAYVLPVAGQRLGVLSWQSTPEDSLSVPAGTSRLVDRPGLTVLPLADEKVTVSLATTEETHYRSLPAPQ